MNSILNRSMAAGLTAFLLSSSCMKKPDMSVDDGPVVPPLEIQTALVDAWGGGDAFTISVNEFAYFEKSLVIATLPPRVVLQDGKTVQSFQDGPTERTYDLLQQTAEISEDNQQQLSTTVRSVTFGKPEVAPKLSPGDVVGALDTVKEFARKPVVAASTSGPVALALGIETMIGALGLCVPGENWNVSCHNLKVFTESEPAPPLIAQGDCHGLPDCRITKKVVAFDLILQHQDTGSDTTVRSRARYTFKVSDQVPYLSRLTDFCYEGLASVDNQKFPVKICESLRNFRRQ